MKPACLSGLRLVLAIVAGALAFTAPSRAEPVEGRDYARLAQPQTPESQGKIEVIEFFSWGCPHCFVFDPLISQWAAQLPANVSFVQVPVSMGHAKWGQLVRAYYALQQTGDLERLDNALFAAIHKEKKQLFDEASLTAWVAQQGVAAGKFREAYNSSNVSTRASHAEQLARNYQVQGIPHLVIDGRYEVLGDNFNQILSNATQVLDMVTKTHGAATSGK